MEREVYGRYVSSLRTQGKLYAVFSKDVIGDQTLVMYEVEDSDLVILKDRGDYSFKRARSLPLRIKSDPIPVYRTSHMPTDRADLELYLTESNCDEETCPLEVTTAGEVIQTNCPWEPPRRVETMGAASTFPWHTPESPVGVLETSWSRRTTATPPPYSRIDNRRRPTSVAYINPERLPESPRPSSTNFPRIPASPNTTPEFLAATPDPRETVSIFGGHNVYDARHSFPPQRPDLTELARVELALDQVGIEPDERAERAERNRRRPANRKKQGVRF